MKAEQNLKIVLIILLIILMSLISFGGIFVQKGNFMENMLPNYQLGMDLKGSRLLEIAVSKSTNKVIYDKDGKVVTEEGEGTTTKEEPVNPQESLTKENYNLAKEILNNRLEQMGIANYTIRFDEETGKMILQLPEDSNTDTIAQYSVIKGEFTVTNEEKEVLLNNSHIKKAQVGYATTEAGTNIYLTIELNEEGTSKLKDITNTYVASTDAEGKETHKDISLNIDGSTLLSTYFEEEISNGKLQLAIGQASSGNDLASYIKEASNLAVLLNTGALPLTYTFEQNRYVMSNITMEMLCIPMIVLLAVIVIGIVFLIIKYKKNGLLCAICFIGYIATLLLILRYTNVVITLEGITGILVSILLNYIFTVYMLHLIKKLSETSDGLKTIFVKTLIIFVPVIIVSVILCFTKWLPIYSFGMTMFWGILLIALYNFVITRTLILASKK